MDKQVNAVTHDASVAPGEAQQGVTGGLTPSRLERVKHQIMASLGQKISVPQLAQSCSLSRSHFSRAFKRSTGMSPQDWIRHQRIAQAKKLIADSTLTLTQISAECGFFDQAHFSHMFSRTAGTNPAVWRRQKLTATAAPAAYSRPAMPQARRAESLIHV